MHRALVVVPAVVCALAPALSGSFSARAATPALKFDRPVVLTRPGAGGFEPELLVDRSGNTWVTAHRNYSPVSPDPHATAQVRSSSWLWMSPDGKSFTDLPAQNGVGTEQQNPDGEGSLSTDAQGNVQFVDLGTATTSLSSWRVLGRGRVEAVRSAPALPLPLLDRPFVSGNGTTVLLAVNDTGAGPDLGAVSSPHDNYALYVSHDGGQTFPTTPYRPVDGPNGIAFCRPHVMARDARRMVAVCLGDDGGGHSRLTAFASKDGGATWSTAVVSAKAGQAEGMYSNYMFPSVTEAPDGTLYVLYHRQLASGVLGQVITGLTRSDLVLYSSHDGGRSCSPGAVVDPEPGLWQQTSISAAPDGRLGLAGYYRRTTSEPWTFRAATFVPGSRDIVSWPVDPGHVALPATQLAPVGEYSQAAFDSRSRLHVVYGVEDVPLAQPVTDQAVVAKQASNSKVVYAQESSPRTAATTGPPGTTAAQPIAGPASRPRAGLAATGSGAVPLVGLGLLGLVLAIRTASRRHVWASGQA